MEERDDSTKDNLVQCTRYKVLSRNTKYEIRYFGNDECQTLNFELRRRKTYNYLNAPLGTLYIVLGTFYLILAT